MRRRPGVLSYPPGAVGAVLGELGVARRAFRGRIAALLERADSGAPLLRREAAALEKAMLSAALGPERIDHRSGAYDATKARIRAGLGARRFEGAVAKRGEQPR